jgi:hypothetical protein
MEVLASLFIEANKDYFPNRTITQKKTTGFLKSHFSRSFHRKTQRSYANSWESDGSYGVLHCQVQAITVTLSQQLLLSLTAALPDWANRMNYPLGWEVITTSNLGFTRVTGYKACTFF